ncbi:hypothetical protein GCWU000182_00690 [Abiotrophia defectiva ATCC 49176]|uniref:Uncharacterized protein n=1 Tax=Abiotrophia defectiva ATCC 49176 TaxID=592010 RepID=W1Q442_ABIDE|nr:hypothetical protein GCWU000182_00690 [Abiotrophia defectiva ATCC 49176]
MLLNHNKEPTISLTNQNINWILYSSMVKYLAYILLTVSIFNLYSYFNIWNIITLFFAIGLAYIFRKLASWIYRKYRLRDNLLYLLRANGLYSERKVNDKTVITSSAILGWEQKVMSIALYMLII